MTEDQEGGEGDALPRSISEWLDLWRDEDEALGIFDDTDDDSE